MSAGLRAGTNNDGYLQINGTDVLTALSSGRIGVGTTNPSALLDVKVATDAKLLVQDGNTTGNVKFNAVNNAVTGNVNFEIAAQDIQLFAGGGERLRVTSTGNVGIGTTNPAEKLDVRGNIYLPSGNYISVGSTENAENYILRGYGSIGWVPGITYTPSSGTGNRGYKIGAFDNVGTFFPWVTIWNGNVGIGTTNPLTKLDTRGALHVGGGTDGIWLGNAGDNSAYDNVKLYYTGYNGGGPRVYLTPRTQPGSGNVNTFLHLQSNVAGGTGSNTMGLIVDGSVGIGTNSPQHKLHVVSGGIVGGSGRGGGFTKTLFESNDATGAYWEFQTTPTSTVNDILFSRGASGNYGIVGYDNSVDKMRFYTASSIRMTIDSTGNVGIGTTNPSLGKLHIEGGSIFARKGSSSILFDEYNNGSILWMDGSDGDMSGGDYWGIYAQSASQWGVNYGGGSNILNITATDSLVFTSASLCVATSTIKQKLTVNGDIGIYRGNGQTRVFTVKGGNGTFSTLTVTVNQNEFGCFVYDLKVHGYAGSYLHYAGGAYENGGIFNPVTTIAQKSASATFTGPTYVSGHTWTITVNWSNAWIHPVAEFSISAGGSANMSESNISMVWS